MAATAIPLDTIPSIDPATGRILDHFEKTPPEKLIEIVARSRATHAQWSAVPAQKRCAQLRILREKMMASRNAFADAVVSETGKPHAEALFADVFVSLDTAVYFAKNGARLLQPERV